MTKKVVKVPNKKTIDCIHHEPCRDYKTKNCPCPKQRKFKDMSLKEQSLWGWICC